MDARVVRAYRRWREVNHYPGTVTISPHSYRSSVARVPAAEALRRARVEVEAADAGLAVCWEPDDLSLSDVWDDHEETCPKRRELIHQHGQSYYDRYGCDHALEYAHVISHDGTKYVASCGAIIDADGAYRREVESDLLGEALGEKADADKRTAQDARTRKAAAVKWTGHPDVKIDSDADVKQIDGRESTSRRGFLRTDSVATALRREGRVICSHHLPHLINSASCIAGLSTYAMKGHATNAGTGSAPRAPIWRNKLCGCAARHGTGAPPCTARKASRPPTVRAPSLAPPGNGRRRH